MYVVKWPVISFINLFWSSKINFPHLYLELIKLCFVMLSCENPFSSWNISIQSPAIYQCLCHAKSLPEKQWWNCSWLFGLKSKSTDHVLEVIWVRILLLILDLIMFIGFTDVSYYLKAEVLPCSNFHSFKKFFVLHLILLLRGEVSRVLLWKSCISRCIAVLSSHLSASSGVSQENYLLWCKLTRWGTFTWMNGG